MKGTEGQPERADVREELQRKKEMLERYVRNLPGPVMVAFSGGVDSTDADEMAKAVREV